jgi:hypothetical protein
MLIFDRDTEHTFSKSKSRAARFIYVEVRPQVAKDTPFTNRVEIKVRRLNI